VTKPLWRKALYIMALGASTACLGLDGSEIDEPSLRIAAVTAFKSNGQRLASLWLPCGTTLVGVYRGGSLDRPKIAAVLKHRSLICARLPRATIIDPANYGLSRKTWLAYAPKVTNLKVQRLKTFDFRVLKTVGQSFHISLLHKSSCGAAQGVLLRKRGHRTVEIGAIAVRKKSDPTSCPSLEHLSQIKINRTYIKHMIPPVDETYHEAEDLFDLRMARIGPRTLRKLDNNHVAFSYKLACNERPLGPIIRFKKNQHTIGMLVMRLYNSGCSSAPRWQLNQTPMALPAQAKIRVFHETQTIDQISLSPATGFNSRFSSNLSSVDHYSTCTPALGVLYSKGRQGETLISIATTRSKGICRAPLVKTDITQPRFSEVMKQGTIFPMVVNGLNYL
jgi:hypothetical protein